MATGGRFTILPVLTHSLTDKQSDALYWLAQKEYQRWDSECMFEMRAQQEWGLSEPTARHRYLYEHAAMQRDFWSDVMATLRDKRSR